MLKQTIEGLESFMERKSYKSIKDFLGICVPEFGYIKDWPREKQMLEKSPILPKFDESLCNRCGICERLCAYDAIILDENKEPVVNEDYCMGCGWCVSHCPKDAIKMVKADTGELIWDGKGLPKKWANT